MFPSFLLFVACVHRFSANRDTNISSNALTTIEMDPSIIPTAVQLVYTTRQKKSVPSYHINEEALDLISKFMKDDTFEVISTIGQARKGKSFTLSRLVQQMTGNVDIVPFASSDFNDPHTHGVWMYMLLKCDGENPPMQETFPCSLDNKPYLILDIQGSYTDTDEETVRYAAIVTLISSQTFLLLHEKLYKHDVDHIRNIAAIIDQINDEQIDFDLSDLNIGAIIREPFRSNFGDAEKAVNEDLARYHNYFEGFGQFLTVQPIPHFDSDEYISSLQQLAQYIAINKESRMKWINNAAKLRVLLAELVRQFNDNSNIKEICVMCVFQNVVEWLPFTSWSNCSKKCDGGKIDRRRECNTGVTADCVRHIGGKSVEEKECNTLKCEWLAYGAWSECSASCKGGTQVRERRCSAGNAQDCIHMFGGSNVEEQACNEQPCEWVELPAEECSAECGKGTQTVRRYCQSGSDDDCKGNNFREQPCQNYVGCFSYLLRTLTYWLYALGLAVGVIIVIYVKYIRGKLW